MTPSLIIAGREISQIAWLDYSQQISNSDGGRVDRRLSNGQMFTIARWKKHKVTLSGSGWVPPALLAIDWSGDVVVELPQPITLAAGDALPAGFTSRSAPWGEKIVLDQAGHTIRLVYVKFTARSSGPSNSSGISDGFSWSLELEQS